MRTEAVDGCFHVFIIQKICDFFVSKIKVKRVRAVKIVVGRVVVLLRRQAFVKTVKSDNAAVVPKLFLYSNKCQ